MTKSAHGLLVHFLVSCLLSTVPLASLAAPGELDATFNGSGYQLQPPAPVTAHSFLRAAVQPDGKLLALSSGSGFGVYRFLPNGALDASYGAGGLGATGSGVPADLALLRDGKLLVLGAAAPAQVRRFNADGSPDLTFAAGGVATAAQSAYASQMSYASSLAAMGVQSDGKVIVVGRASYNVQYSYPYSYPCGTYQYACGSVQCGCNIFGCSSCTLWCTGTQYCTGYNVSYQNHRSAFVARFNADGSFDGTFGNGGYLYTGFTTNDAYASDVKILADDSIVVAGRFSGVHGVLKLTAGGFVDAGFGSAGYGYAPGLFTAHRVAVQPDGRLLLSGEGPVNGQSHGTLTRFTASGSMDATFGTGGAVQTPSGSGSSARDVVVQSDGKVLAAGLAVTDAARATVARYTAEGQPDSDFGAGGMVTVPVAGSVTSTANAVVLGPDGEIVVAGFSRAHGMADRGLLAVLQGDVVNAAPVAVDDAYLAEQDRPLSVSAAGVLANDSDPDGDALAAVLVNGPTHGTLTLSAGGSFLYMPAAGYHGVDAFSYAASDGLARSGTAVVTLKVKGAQSITFAPPASPAAYGSSFAVVATSSAALPVQWSATGSCVISSGTVTMTSGIGSCTLTASQMGNPDYVAAADVVRTVQAARAAQAIAFAPLGDRTYGDAPFGASASASSGLAVELASATPQTCRVSSGTVTPLAAGSCVVTASQAGNDNFAPAGAEQAFTVRPRPVQVSADPQSKFQGNADAALSYGVGGTLVAGDAFTGGIVRDPGESAGVYRIRQGTLSLGGNYEITFEEAAFEIVAVAVAGPVSPIAAGERAALAVSFRDTGMQTSPTCAVQWHEGAAPEVSAMTVVGGRWTCAVDRTFLAAGMHSPRVTVSDARTGTWTKVLDTLVVYDPNAGFVTAGGWLQSSAGALASDRSLAGKANFGLVAKYLRSDKVPTGETQFQLMPGFAFKSSAYEWLVVAGAQAQYRGTGTVNGVPGFGFEVHATEGKPTGGKDTIRMKVWDTATGNVVYDSGAVNLGGGSVSIKK